MSKLVKNFLTPLQIMYNCNNSNAIKEHRRLKNTISVKWRGNFFSSCHLRIWRALPDINYKVYTSARLRYFYWTLRFPKDVIMRGWTVVFDSDSDVYFLFNSSQVCDLWLQLHSLFFSISSPDFNSNVFFRLCFL